MKSQIAKVLSALIFISLFTTMMGVQPAYAANFSVNNSASLITAINTANTNGANDVITLTANITLSAVDNTSLGGGDNGLPIILADGGNSLTIEGGGFTLARGGAAPAFRFMLVNSGANLTINNLTISNGFCDSCAGGAIINSGTLTITNSAFQNNSVLTLGNGGAIYNNGDVTVSNSTFFGNSARQGGAMFNLGTISAQGSTFSSNTATLAGGGILNLVTLTVTNSTFSGNDGDIGGGIASIGSFAVMTVSNSRFTNNSAATSGGGMEANGDITILNNLTFISNLSTNGGGLSAGGPMTLTNSVFAGNSVTGNGGGIYNNGTPLSMANVTLYANSASLGGGIYNPGRITIRNNTLSNNNATTGGGINSTGPAFVLVNTIVANSTGGGDCVGTPTSTPINNLIKDSTNACGMTNGVNGNIIGSDPNLGTLASNGGPTMTQALNAGSLAIDAGDATTCANSPVSGRDQRGTTRPQGAECDIGAYEADSVPPAVTINQTLPGQADPTNASPILFTAVFSEAINTSSFTSADVTLGGTAPGTLSAVITEVSPNDGTTFEVSVSGMSGSGTVTASISAGAVQDFASNNNTASVSADNTVTYILDSSAPTVTINQASGQADPTYSTPIKFTAVFSEAIDISTFTATDITFGGTAPGTLSAVITEVSPNDGTTFEVSVSGMSGSGTVTASIGAGAVQDFASNNNTASASADNTVMYILDSSVPTVISNTLVSTYTIGPSNFAITFSENVNNSGGGANANDAANPANYLLVERGTNATFDTISCIGGLATDDTQIAISGITYIPNTAIVNLGSALPVGTYRLFVCGTTSIVDLALNELNGGLSDYTFDFIVSPIISGTDPTDEETEDEQSIVSSLPKTGFTPNRITSLPAQPASAAYADLGSIWLEIPSQNLITTIVGVPKTDKGWDVKWLGQDTGWLNGTAFPSWEGNSVLTAHVTDSNGLAGPFTNLKALRYGDQIIVHLYGQQYIFEVRNSRLARPSTTSFAFEHLEDHSFLTLITCQGYNPLSDSYFFRRIVRAVLVEVK